MKNCLRVLVTAFVVAGLSVDDVEAPSGTGSCYEAKPICMQGHPVCMCTLSQQCYWVCK